MTEWFTRLSEGNQIMIGVIGFFAAAALGIRLVDSFTAWGERRALRKIRRG